MGGMEGSVLAAANFRLPNLDCMPFKELLLKCKGSMLKAAGMRDKNHVNP